MERWKIKDIIPLTIREWQNKILEHNYKQTYLRTINIKLVAILNHAVKFYNLKQNPCNLTTTLNVYSYFMPEANDYLLDVLNEKI